MEGGETRVPPSRNTAGGKEWVSLTGIACHLDMPTRIHESEAAEDVDLDSVLVSLESF